MHKNKKYIQDQVDQIIKERLFAAIRKIIIEEQKNKYTRSSEFLTAQSSSKKQLLDKHFKQWYESIGSFFLSLKSINALYFLVNRELKIREFISQEVVRVKADYSYNEIEFSALYPAHFNATMTKEIEDCISELSDPKYAHIVENYSPKKDTERSPHEPLTTAKLKYSAFYLFGFEPEYVTYLATQLYEVGIITNPETNGWNIDNEIVEDIITSLNKKYDPNIVMQYRRTYTDKLIDRSKECIRPVAITKDFYPRTITLNKKFVSIEFKDAQEIADAQKLYEFIFYITLSTQMKNSIYDTSKLEITVGPKKLTAQANEIIEGQENWELLSGSMIRRISQNDNVGKEQVIVLPDLKQDTILKPHNIYAYSYQKQRSPRYGVGRFITQILEKNGIGDIKDHDIIIQELISSKTVVLVKTMLYPQEPAIILIKWLQEYLEPFINLEYHKELDEKITLASNNEITSDSIYDEINRLIDGAFERSGYVDDEDIPSLGKIKLVQAIAAKNNLHLDQSIYKSNVKMDMVLAQYPVPEAIKIGSCPSCNALVYQKEYIDPETGEVAYYFSCENFKRNGGCNFSIWDSYIYKFFSDKAIEQHTIQERADTLKKILSKKKGYLFNGFTAKNQKEYDAKVKVKQYQDKQKNYRWCLELAF